MAQKYLVDTNILIDYLRGLDGAVNFLEKIEEPLCISSLTVAELYAGVREGKERKILNTFITAFEILPVNDNTSPNIVSLLILYKVMIDN